MLASESEPEHSLQGPGIAEGDRGKRRISLRFRSDRGRFDVGRPGIDEMHRVAGLRERGRRRQEALQQFSCAQALQARR